MHVRGNGYRIILFFFSYRTTIPLRTTRDMVLHAREEKREKSRRALAAATILSRFELEFFLDFGLSERLRVRRDGGVFLVSAGRDREN